MEEKLLSNRILERDIEVVKMLSNGSNVSQIAEKTHVKPKTIEQRLFRLRDKLGIKSAAHLTAFFVRNKIIE